MTGPERATAGTTARLPGKTPLCRMAYPEVRPTVVTDGPVSAITPNLLGQCLFHEEQLQAKTVFSLSEHCRYPLSDKQRATTICKRLAWPAN